MVTLEEYKFGSREDVVLPKVTLLGKPEWVGAKFCFQVENVFTGRILTIRINARTREADLERINSLDENKIYDLTVEPHAWKSDEEPILYFKEVKES